MYIVPKLPPKPAFLRAFSFPFAAMPEGRWPGRRFVRGVRRGNQYQQGLAVSEDSIVHRPSRSGVEIGYVITVSIMLLTLAFNAGIEYARINGLEANQAAQAAQIAQNTAANTPTQVRLGRIETILGEIQQQQATIQASITKNGNGG